MGSHAFDLVGLAHCLEKELEAVLAQAGLRSRQPGVDGSRLSRSPSRRQFRSIPVDNSMRARCRRTWAVCRGRLGAFCLRLLCLRRPLAEADGSMVDPSLLCDGHLALARAHRGFLMGYLALRRELLSLVRRRLAEARRDRRRLAVYTTGHSLGGALATLALLDLRVALQQAEPESATSAWPAPRAGAASAATPSGGSTGSWPAIGCYTFGAPSPGNSAFRTLFNLLAPREVFRVVARRDLIAACPPGLGFRQVGREVWFDAAGEPTFCMSWSMRQLLPRRRRLRDHRLREYYLLLGAKFLRDRSQCYASPWAGEVDLREAVARGLLAQA